MPSERKTRGRSRVHRHTYDIDNPRAQVHAPLGGDGSLESSAMCIAALLETIHQARQMTAAAVRYSQGAITRVAQDAVTALLTPAEGFDHWSGTNDLAASQIAKAAACSKRQWLRVKPLLQELGIIDYQHRSVKSGLPKAAGVDEDIQISDVYWFTPDKLKPWLREIYDAILARMKARAAARAQQRSEQRARTPLIKRDRPHRRIPALLNPVGWMRAIAADAKSRACPAASYAAEEARAVAFAMQVALKSLPG